MVLTGDAANIRQGDNFLSIIVPAIMASPAYKNDGAIIIWWDESEDDAVGDNGDHLNHTIGEIVISPRARERGRTAVCASSVALTHSSNLRTMQETFHMTKPFFVGEAIHAEDLSSLTTAPFPATRLFAENCLIGAEIHHGSLRFTLRSFGP